MATDSEHTGNAIVQMMAEAEIVEALATRGHRKATANPSAATDRDGHGFQEPLGLGARQLLTVSALHTRIDVDLYADLDVDFAVGFVRACVTHRCPACLIRCCPQTSTQGARS